MPLFICNAIIHRDLWFEKLFLPNKALRGLPALTCCQPVSSSVLRGSCHFTGTKLRLAQASLLIRGD
jgi:hypothetical protein